MKKFPTEFSFKAAIFCIVAIALAASGLQIYGTTWGAGVSPDSVNYLSAAWNLHAGNGLIHLSEDGMWIPLTLWAPVYPLLLTIGEILGPGALWFGRFLNSLLFFLNVLLVFLMTTQVTRKNWALSLLAGIFFMLSLDIQRVHAWAWTEPGTIFFGFLGFVLLDKYFRSGRVRALAFASICFSIASLLRYAGLIFFFTGCLAYFVFLGKSGWKERLEHLLAFILISAGPFFIWSVRNSMVARSPIGRELIFNLPGVLATLEDIGMTASIWLIPGRLEGPIRMWVSLLVMISWITLTVVMLRKDDRRRAAAGEGRDYLGCILIFFIVLYPIMPLLINVFFDPGIHVDGRILALPYVSALVLTIFMVASNYSGQDLRTRMRINRSQAVLSLMLLGIFIPIFAMNVVHTIEWIGDANRRGLGFSSASWHNSEVIDYLQEVDENLYFLSNAPDGIYFWTRRMAGMIPETTDEAEQLARRKYLEEGYDDIWIVFFRGGFRKGEVPAERELKLDLGLEPVFGDEEASIYSFQFGG